MKIQLKENIQKKKEENENMKMSQVRIQAK